VYCSPLSRVAESARIIADARGLVPIARDGLREIGHGHWEELTRREVAERFPDEFAVWEEDPSPSHGNAQASTATPDSQPLVFREIITSHPAQCVLVVSHKATLRLVLCSLVRLDPRGYRDRWAKRPPA
jgi:broad specificity phosphatase PhoE